VLGEVNLDEGGKVRFQNIDYQIVRGTVSFQNPFRIDPFFDVTLEARVSGGISEIESGPLTVTVNITGTIDRISPSITSDPPASDVTLFSLLGLGGLANKNGSQEPTNAALAGRSLLFQSAARLLGSRVLPFVDSFSLDVGQSGQERHGLFCALPRTAEALPISRRPTARAAARGCAGGHCDQLHRRFEVRYDSVRPVRIAERRRAALDARSAVIDQEPL